MLWLPPLAFALDLLFADPRALPHPVRGIGLLADAVERQARKLPWPALAGGLSLVFLLLAVFCIACALLALPSLFGLAAAVYLSWSGLALGGLLREGEAALAAIVEAERQLPRHGESAATPALQRARGMVQLLVSRDVSNMSAEELCRSLAETLSENFNDAFTAPYFWLCLGGPLSLWLYKTVSTLDSMWGYKNERWRRFGTASARLDDILAWAPARLSMLFMLLAFRIQAIWDKRAHSALSLPASALLRKIRQQAGQCESPNAGWPMSAAAWLFKGRCGGPTPYDGRMVAKPLLGPPDGKWRADNTLALIRHLRLAGFVAAVLLLPFSFLVCLI